MERTPQEARQRWLRLTGRLGGGISGEGGREEEGGDRAPGSPSLDTFYVQVGSTTRASALGTLSKQHARVQREPSSKCYCCCFHYR